MIKENNTDMNKTNESGDPHGGLPMQLGPMTNFDMFYNKKVVNNTLSSDPGKVVGMDTEVISDDYFDGIDPVDVDKEREKATKKRRKKKVLDFDEFNNEGAGFGNVDYRDVTGNATSSGYLGDQQQVGGGGGGATIATDLPRGNWHEPSTVIVGMTNDTVRDPYFLRNKKTHTKSKKKRDYDKEKRDKVSARLNRRYRKGDD